MLTRLNNKSTCGFASWPGKRPSAVREISCYFLQVQTSEKSYDCCLLIDYCLRYVGVDQVADDKMDTFQVSVAMEIKTAGLTCLLLVV
jgi:hypothetical protein